MKAYKTLYLFIFLLLGVYACPPPPDPPQGPTTRELIVLPRTISSITTNGTAVSTTNAQVEFTVGGQYTLRIPDFSGLANTGSWTLSSDEKTIILEDGSTEVMATIVSISETSMVLEFSYEYFKGNTVTYRITLNS
ncbi:hypothetical protein WJR50_17755 [Catalinimonas sp. 4WD22]|uniref:hypothetical protein n=1 Tax=Catalinimonas locisalis TaxID=3133978 RepID=UPI003100E077